MPQRWTPSIVLGLFLFSLYQTNSQEIHTTYIENLKLEILKELPPSDSKRKEVEDAFETLGRAHTIIPLDGSRRRNLISLRGRAESVWSFGITEDNGLPRFERLFLGSEGDMRAFPIREVGPKTSEGVPFSDRSKTQLVTPFESNETESKWNLRVGLRNGCLIDLLLYSQRRVEVTRLRDERHFTIGRTHRGCCRCDRANAQD